MRQGTVILAGGGGTPPDVPRLILQLAGGANAKVVVLAHTQEDIERGGRRSAEFIQENGGQNVHAPSTTDPDALTEILSDARGIWIPGGDQNRLMARLGSSEKFLRAVRGVYERGGVVGGTSAGASLMGSLMPTGEQSPDGDLKVGACTLASGLGILRNCIVDQHFLKRQRTQRLLCALLQNPDCVGIGVDEDAWVVVQGEMLTAHRAQVFIARVTGKVRQSNGMLGTNDLRVQIVLPGETVRWRG